VQGCVGVLKKIKKNAVPLTHISEGGLWDGFVQLNDIIQWVISLQKGQKWLSDICKVSVMLAKALQCPPSLQDKELFRKVGTYLKVPVI